MSPETLRNLANFMLIVGLGIAALGTFGVNHFRSVIEARREKHQGEGDAQQAVREAELNNKLEELLRGNATLQDRLAPFEKVARERYPTFSSEEALQRLSSGMTELKSRATALENKTSTPTLTIKAGEVTRNELGLTLEILLQPSNALPIDEVTIEVKVESPIAAKIVSFSPGGMNYMVKTRQSADGHNASLAFTPTTSGPIHVFVVVSDPATLLFTGNHGIVPTKVPVALF